MNKHKNRVVSTFKLTLNNRRNFNLSRQCSTNISQIRADEQAIVKQADKLEEKSI
ncbi:MAG TPA: hypothetical protein GXX77_01805 [Candidatus Cloacimonetes bacterium]|nr:hypothetical protein [Candidatus Cloacimonadota bacterium]